MTEYEKDQFDTSVRRYLAAMESSGWIHIEELVRVLSHCYPNVKFTLDMGNYHEVALFKVEHRKKEGLVEI